MLQNVILAPTYKVKNEGKPMTIRLLLVDDHAVVRQGLRMFLSLDPDFEIVGEAADGNAALKLARELQPDVVLMDLLMPGMDGIEATGILRKEMPDIEVIALTSVLEDSSVVGAIRAGAIVDRAIRRHSQHPCGADIQ